MSERLKHIGIDSFFVERKKLLDAYDAAKQQTCDDPVKTEHGVVAEREVRRWLESFLPKRFGVCKGYIITTNLEFRGDLEEWDVIVYDAIESPVLYTRGSPDQNSSDQKRAIPVEHVRAVLEVKATLTPAMAKKSAGKIFKLGHYIGLNTSNIYPTYLTQPFVCAALFLESKVESLTEYRNALDNLSGILQQGERIPFMGALVVRSQRQEEHPGYLRPLISGSRINLPEGDEYSSEYQYADGSHGVFGALCWDANSYSTFLFDFLASIRGTRTNLFSSFYGFDTEDIGGSRLFHPVSRKRVYFKVEEN